MCLVERRVDLTSQLMTFSCSYIKRNVVIVREEQELRLIW